MAKINTKKVPLLAQVIAAIILGILLGGVCPVWLTRVFATFNGLFSNFLGFIIPVLILGLIAPGIADLGKTAGKMLLITVILAYGFTLFSGFFTYLVAGLSFDYLLAGADFFGRGAAQAAANAKAYFSVAMPPLMDVMTALILGFLIGLGTAVTGGKNIKTFMEELRSIIYAVINKVIIPLIPLYIFGIFLDMTAAGQVASILAVFLKIIILIFFITIVMLLIQFSIAGAAARKNPFKMLKNMLPAYFTALGTQSSAATIPVTLEQTLTNGVRRDVADFVVPLCATIHLSGSTMKIVACSLAIMFVSGMPVHFGAYSGFIFMLGITMVAAPGVPGGAIMAAVGILQSMLGFDEQAIGLMIALYIAMDSFGTACNVTGDGAIAVIINKIYKGAHT
ncbi:MAG: dicarboxylate/amino acid:cation symporter [Elusimicrobiota bacterium]|jgi:Na+/H+-dicarboxylate symporter|nr:dicarboxylate/amino acid:cation symporter [Elusimicrobiota bacterium]